MGSSTCLWAALEASHPTPPRPTPPHPTPPHPTPPHPTPPHTRTCIVVRTRSCQRVSVERECHASTAAAPTCTICPLPVSRAGTHVPLLLLPLLLSCLLPLLLLLLLVLLLLPLLGGPPTPSALPPSPLPLCAAPPELFDASHASSQRVGSGTEESAPPAIRAANSGERSSTCSEEMPAGKPQHAHIWGCGS
jgi:hypothetical protein